MAFTVADYILKRLSEQHVETLFGVPAAYCAPLFEAASGHGVKSVVTASDLEAGYAADGYARTKGIGAVSVAYGVGTLSMIDAIAGADVERSPVVVINGGPTSANLSNLHQFDVVFSHSIGQDATDLAAYKLVTANAAPSPKCPMWSLRRFRPRSRKSARSISRSTWRSGIRPVRCHRDR